MSSRGESRLPAFAGKARAFMAKLQGFLRGHQHEGEFEDEMQEHLRRLAGKFVHAEGRGRVRRAATVW